VVSTGIRDVVRPYGEKGLVAIAPDAARFAREAEGYLTTPKDDLFAKIDRHLARLSWDKTWSAMDDHIRSAIAQNTRFAAGTGVAAAERANA
jgi:hypothetical protein